MAASFLQRTAPKPWRISPPPSTQGCFSDTATAYASHPRRQIRKLSGSILLGHAADVHRMAPLLTSSSLFLVELQGWTIHFDLVVEHMAVSSGVFLKVAS